jgi:hypothetical protein
MGRRRLVRTLVASSVVVLGAAGCGADAIDRGQEARTLALTCRSLQERASDTAGVQLSEEQLAAYLRSPSDGSPDLSVISTLRRLCNLAGRQQRHAEDRSLDRSDP